MSEVHIHLHFNSGGGDVPSPLFNELKRILTMNAEELTAALDAAKAQIDALTAKLDATNAQLDKGINEVILAISNAGSSVPQSVVDAVARLQASLAPASAEVDETASKAQTIDDMNEDQQPQG